MSGQSNPHRLYRPERSQTSTIILLLALALVIGLGMRLYLAATYYGSSDQTNFEQTARLLMAGGNIYGDTDKYNYPPIYAVIATAWVRVADTLQLPMNFPARGFMCIVDLLNTVIIGLIGEHLRPGTGWFSAALHLLSLPVIALVGYVSQFEPLALLPLLLATWLILRGGRPTLWIWLLATLSILFKQNTVFALWMFLVIAYKPRRAALLFTGSVALFALSFAPFLTEEGAIGVYQHVLRYGADYSIYGFGRIFPSQLAGLLMFIALFALPFVALWRRLTLVNAIMLSFTVLMIMLYGISEQYFYLPLAWGAFQTRRSAIPFMIMTLIMTPAPFNLIFNHLIRVNPDLILVGLVGVWLTAWGWSAAILMRPKHTVIATSEQATLAEGAIS